MTTTRQEWLLQRQRVVGGSDVAAILGLSRWRTPFDVWHEKTSTLRVEDESKKPWLKRGKYLESAITRWYADEMGVSLMPMDSSTLSVGPEPWMAGSVDALVDADPVYGLECKTSRFSDEWGEPGSDAIPVETQLQAAWYCAVKNVNRWDIAVLLTLKEEFRRYTLHRDFEVERHIVDTCRDWWFKHVVANVPPPVDGSAGASEWLQKRFPRAVEPLRAASIEESDLVSKLNQTRKELRRLEKQDKELKNQVAAAIGTAEGLQWSGGTVTYKEQKRTTVDIEALRSEMLDAIKPFERTTSMRVLRIKTTSNDEE